MFDVTNPASSLLIIGQGEVGADVTTLRVSGAYAFIGTSKSGQEFQVWNSDYSAWNPSVLNAGRLTSYSFAHLAPAGMDLDGNWVYAISQWSSAPGDVLQVLYAP